MKETLPNPYDDQQTLPPRLRAQNGRISTPVKMHAGFILDVHITCQLSKYDNFFPVHTKKSVTNNAVQVI